MGRILLIWRLVVRDLRRRPAEAVLLLLAITAATATLALGLAMNGVSDQPYLSTRAATNGPDVVVSTSNQSQPGQPSLAVELTDMRSYETASGVTAYDGPYPSTSPVLTFDGRTVTANAEGRDTAPATIDHPDVTQGTWVRPGGIVVERTFAVALGVSPGDTVTLNGRVFQVDGIAVSAASPPYPYGNPIWLTQADALSFATSAQPPSYSLNLKLADPAAAEAFENAHLSDQDVYLSSWQDIGSQDQQVFGAIQSSLLIGSWLLSLLAIAGVAVLVGGRMADQTRRVGLLKAIGATPRLVTIVLLAENLFLALLAAGIGLAAGWLAAPLLTGPGASLLGSASAPALSLTTIVLVVVAALAVATAATLIPALRAARTSTLNALADSSHAPRRRARLIAVSARLPLPLLLGLRLAARRPRRTVLSVISTMITVTGIVAVLSSVRTHEVTRSAAGQAGLENPRTELQSKVLMIIALMLLVLTVVNAVLTIWAGSLDSTRPVAVARALGATPFEVAAGLSAAQLLPTLLGAVLGLPFGLGLVSAVASGHGKVTALPPALWLLGVVLGTPLVMAVLAVIPARIGARRSVAGILQSELG